MARQDDRGTILWTDKKRTFLGLPLSFTRYYLTDHQLITRVGFLSIKEDEIELYRIVDKRIEQTFFQRLFGCGTVIILSRDEDTPEKHLVSIRQAHRQLCSRAAGKFADRRQRYDRCSICGRRKWTDFCSLSSTG